MCVQKGRTNFASPHDFDTCSTHACMYYLGHFAEIHKPITIICLYTNLQWVDHVQVCSNIGETWWDFTRGGERNTHKPCRITATRSYFKHLPSFLYWISCHSAKLERERESVMLHQGKLLQISIIAVEADFNGLFVNVHHHSLFKLVSQFLALLLKISDNLELLKSLLTLQKTKPVINNSTQMHSSTFTCIITV